jgi:aryl-alcohol dehydrogenase-like predicted oxidoreductase
MSQTITLWDGRSVPRIGVGCWAIGGKQMAGSTSVNYAGTNDADSLAGLHAAAEMGARFFDTATAYGYGHSEELLGQAFGGRDDIVIVTKFAYSGDSQTRIGYEPDVTPAGIRSSIDASRRRLRRDRLDLALLHINDHPPKTAGPIFDTLEALVAEGKIAAFGWSTDAVDSVRAFADRPGFVAVENDFNLFDRAEAMMDFVAQRGLLSISRLPLAMGLLTGKYNSGARVGAGDIRSEGLDWLKFFSNGKANPQFATRIEAVRDLLTGDGRTLAQGALGWILARSPNALPVPGFKTEAQVRDNLGALAKGPLSPATMAEIDVILQKDLENA